MKQKLLKKLTLILVVIVGVFLGASSSYAYEIWFNGGFCPTPATLYCYSGFLPATMTAVTDACNEWTMTGEGILATKSSTTHNNTNAPYLNGLNQITKGERGSNEYLMACYETDAIYGPAYNTLYEADIDINVSYDFGDASINSNLYDVQGIMTHEIGHLLGLDHSSVSYATMISGSAPGWTWKRTIENDDKDGITAIYSFID